ncbi:protein prenylyltransferase [Dunaliella salina]|uniref:Protein prenylyltransferase n=1 Tax=Dunaliella salina TaxID=3046 RepID=A0ABQ7G6Y9_DUNSA|nr:protein prenylyltransferase [Dunaliella salina]|eukprot:KAF5830373.1 protein prenylyltransferase [Dunaliella salina]
MRPLSPYEARAPKSDGAGVIDDLMPSQEDLLYEEELLRNPYALKMWVRYIQARQDAPAKRRYLLYERALKSLPGSYKLWYAYLRERRTATRGMRIDHPAVASLNNTYERALVSMHKMPRIWLDYLELLVEQKFVTKARRTFDRALAALPITQHDRVWVLYLPGVPVDTAIRVYRRYLKLEPEHAEEYIAYLKAKNRWGEAAQKLAELLNDDTFRSLEGKSKHQMWLELCDIITKHPKDVQEMKVEAILRGGIRKFTDEVGRLWTSLADFYIRHGMFERARDVYEEGMNAVVTVHDFSLIFDALTQFEESLLSAKMEALGMDDEPEQAQDDDGTDFLLKDDGNDIDLRLARLEHLMTRRPELLSSVVLRQNPHNVAEWHKRVKLFVGNPTRQILTYTEAVKTVDIEKALGKPHSLWCAFAKFYEHHGDVGNARVIFEKAVQVPFKYVDDLAQVWCEWAEMELRHQNFRRALDLVKRATTMPPGRAHSRMTVEEERQLPVQQRLYKSLKLWMFATDLEESLGTVESTQAAYDRIMELRIATPQVILNYGAFLQRYVKNNAFVCRYGGKKLERARDLFEHALSMAPPEESKPLYLEYALLEERYGLAKHCMEVYERASKSVPKAERMSIYDIYIAKASEFFSIGKHCMEVYKRAPEAVPKSERTSIYDIYVARASEFFGIDKIDRARAIFVHASTLANPRVDHKFWLDWKQFEVAHGNEDTFREMLRIQRSVAASYSHTQVQSVMDTVRVAESMRERAAAGQPMDAMAALEAEANASMSADAAAAEKSRALPGFVSAGVIQQGQQQGGPGGKGGVAANPEELDIDMDGGGEEQDTRAGSVGAAGAQQGNGEAGEGGGGEDEDGADVQVKAVPASVYGNLASAVGDKREEEGGMQGAMERLKKRRVGQ